MASTMSSTMRDISIHDYLHVFAVSFLFYDHAITLGDEVEYLWKRPKTRSTLWFFVTRYMGLFGNIAVTILAFTSMSSASCKRYSLYRQILLVATQVVVCILLTLRIYALYGCSSRILAFMLASGLVLLGISSWSLFGQKIVDAPQAAGCHTGLGFKTSIRIAAAWEALLVYDCIIFGLTIFKTWTARLDHAITGINIPLITLLLRDGAIYFVVLAFCNLSNILTFYVAGPFMRGGLSTFASCISLTMICRLMLNLHRTADSGIYTTDRTLTDGIFTSDYRTGAHIDIMHPTDISDIETQDPPHPVRFRTPIPLQ
ncbi:hypothetical protein D9619_011401 [Psilocybe cf. subviscida]|uniref:DUF6533 domain-containing protein n=1 Tax=Psilocybe cf. subviscida TaxID=2480587 RepID=A0A8H5BLC9_9AGAR|nr:hypothetical protein D9619_011401 [Psilocybe cf. subviscida]